MIRTSRDLSTSYRRQSVGPFIGGAAVLLASLVWFGLAARQGFDAHHQGYMLRNAIDVANGRTLFSESWSWYQPIPTYLNAFGWIASGSRLIGIQLLTALAYALSALLAWLMSARLSVRIAAALALIAFLTTAPEVGLNLLGVDEARPPIGQYLVLLPWPSSWALVGGLAVMLLVVTVGTRAREWSLGSMALLGVFCGLTFGSRLSTGLLTILAVLMVAVPLTSKSPREAIRLYPAIILTSAVVAMAGYLPTLIDGGAAAIWEQQVSSPADWGTGGQTWWTVVKTYAGFSVPGLWIGAIAVVQTLTWGPSWEQSRQWLPWAALVAVLLAVLVILTVGTPALTSLSGLLRKPLVIVFLAASGLVLLVRETLWRRTRWNWDTGWIATGGLLAGIVTAMLALSGYEQSAFRLLVSLKGQDALPLLVLSMAMASIVTCMVVSCRQRDRTRPQVRTLFAAASVAFVALVQLYPVFEARHIWWAGISLALLFPAATWVAFADQRRAAASLAVPAGIVLVIAALGVAGWAGRQTADWESVADARALDLIVTRDGDFGNTTGAIDATERYLASHPQTPVVVFGHENGMFALSSNTAAPKWSVPPGGGDLNAATAFVRERKPVVWIEGDIDFSGQENALRRLSYCVLYSQRSIEGRSFDLVVGVPCRRP